MKSLLKIILLAVVSSTILVNADAEGDVIFSHSFEDPITVSWDGGGDGMTWADEVNWVGDKLPADGNAVVINDPGSPTVIYDASLGTTHLHSLESTESLTMTGGALELNRFSWSTGTLTVAAGTSVTVLGPFEHTNGTVTGAGEVTVAGLYTWLDGLQTGSGETIANGGILVSGGATKSLSARTLTLNGASTWDAGQWNLGDAATINNNAALDIQAHRRLAHAGGAVSTFNNNALGIITNSAGVGGSTIETHFSNSGMVNANSGTLTLGRSDASGNSVGDFVSGPGATLALQGNLNMLAASSFSGAGGVSVTAGGTVVIEGSFTTTGPVSVSSGGLTFDTVPLTLGSVTVSGGTLTASSDLAITGTMQHTNGTVAGAGEVTVAGLYTWLDGLQTGSAETIANGGILVSGGATKSLSARTLTLNGASTWDAGQWNLGDAATINNNAALDIQADKRLAHAGGAVSTFNNNALGIITKSAGVGVSNFELEFTNAGNFSVESGSVVLNRSFTQTSTGTLNVEISSISDFDNYPVSQSATLDGMLEITLLDGFEPSLTEMYTIMNFASRVGTFATVNGLAIGSGKQFDISYGATSITLEVIPDP